jgi:hypothetical protein
VGLIVEPARRTIPGDTTNCASLPSPLHNGVNESICNSYSTVTACGLSTSPSSTYQVVLLHSLYYAPALTLDGLPNRESGAVCRTRTYVMVDYKTTAVATEPTRHNKKCGVYLSAVAGLQIPCSERPRCRVARLPRLLHRFIHTYPAMTWIILANHSNPFGTD